MCNKNENTSVKFYEFKYLSGNLIKLPHPSQIDLTIPRKISGFKYRRRPTSQWTLGCHNYEVSWQYWVFWKSCTFYNISHKNFVLSFGRSSVCPFVHSLILSKVFFKISLFSGVFGSEGTFCTFLLDFCWFWYFCCILKQQIICLLRNF